MGRGMFEVKITISLSAEHVEFLKDLVEKGAAGNMSQTVRRCVNTAREGLPEKARTGYEGWRFIR